MTSNRARWRTRSRRVGALIPSLLVVAIASGSAASAATPRTVRHPDDGLQALRAAAVTAAAAAPSGVDRAAYQAGVEAYIWGSPLVVMARTRAALVCAAGVNTFLDQTSLSGPSSRLVVTPNTDTLYSSAWLDLRAGPVVLRIPTLADRYYAFQLLDMYTNTITNVGSRTIGQGPASVAVALSNWKGRLQVGNAAVNAPAPDMWVGSGVPCRSVADVPNARQRSRAHTPHARRVEGLPAGTGSWPMRAAGSGNRCALPERGFSTSSALRWLATRPRRGTPVLRDPCRWDRGWDEPVNDGDTGAP